MKEKERRLIPRVKNLEFSERTDEVKVEFLSDLKNLFDVSSMDDFLKMDISFLDDNKLFSLIAMNLNIIEKGSKYLDLYPFIHVHYKRERFKPTLPPRERELCIIRTGYLCQADYECIHHINVGLELGLTVDEIIRIFEGPDAPEWSRFDSAILRATDELHNNYFICDDTWDTLSEQYDEHQKLEFTLLVGQYTKLAMFINSTGTDIESAHSGYAELSEKMNNDKRVKKAYECINEIAKIYRNEIVEGQFDNARTKFKNVHMKYYSK
ncbi:MAG: carboxymuconolactone decarboxylase family protein [Promethearchaeota archaeon]|jgi:alkylhydroperoxidase family enzyme